MPLLLSCHSVFPWNHLTLELRANIVSAECNVERAEDNVMDLKVADFWRSESSSSFGRGKKASFASRYFHLRMTTNFVVIH